MVKLKKKLFLLGLASFFNDVASEMIFPILPLFFSQVLGLNKSLIGLIEGVAEGLSSFLKVFSGWLSDKLRRRKIFLLYGYSIPFLTKSLLALSVVWQHVLFFRILDRSAKGIRTSPRDALISQLSNIKSRGHYFGFHRMMDTLGAVVGGLITFFLLYFVGANYRFIFWVTMIPAFLSFLVIFLFLKEKNGAFLTRFKIKFSSFSPKYKKFIFVSFLFSIANFSYAFIILRTSDLGVASLIIPLMYFVYNLASAASSYFFGTLSDKFGRLPLIFLGYLLFSFVCFGFIFTNKGIFLWFLFALYGVALAIIETVPSAYIGDLVEEHKRGTAYGIYFTVLGFGVLISNILIGLLWDKFSYVFSFSFGAFLALFSAFLLFIFFRK